MPSLTSNKSNKIAIIITIIIMYAASKSFSLKSMFGSQNENNICTYVMWSVLFFSLCTVLCIYTYIHTNEMKMMWTRRHFHFVLCWSDRFQCWNMLTHSMDVYCEIATRKSFKFCLTFSVHKLIFLENIVLKNMQADEKCINISLKIKRQLMLNIFNLF